MSKLFLIVLLIAHSLNSIVPPATVLKAFKLKFPDAVQVKWIKENTHSYEAEFKIKHASFSAVFSDTGKWVETESHTNFISLPKKVQDKINTSPINKATIKAIMKIEKSNGANQFELKIKKRKKLLEIFYNENGQVIKK